MTTYVMRNGAHHAIEILNSREMAVTAELHVDGRKIGTFHCEVGRKYKPIEQPPSAPSKFTFYTV